MTKFASQMQPCLLCGMPEFDHGDGSPTDHPFDPDLNWVSPEEEVVAEAEHETQVATSADRFEVRGNCVFWDGQSFIECVEPEAAQGLVEMFREVLRMDLESRTRVRAKVRRDRVEKLTKIIARPSVKLERFDTEAPEHWAARAVMQEVDGWLL